MLTKDKTSIYVISDSIGETAELVAQAAKIQFNSSVGDIIKFPYVFEEYQIDEIISRAKNEKCLLLYTLVTFSTKKYLKLTALRNNVPAIDVLGPVINALIDLTGRQPKLEAGLNRRLDAKYFKMIEAIEFAVKYDDGKDPRGILKADIILVGISRTSKTPLSMYLAYRNIKVANVPLVPEFDPPKELYQVSSKKVIGLTNDPEKLNSIRLERLKELGIKKSSNYANMDRILDELEYADTIFNQIKCPVINVSTKAIEETASIITSIIS